MVAVASILVSAERYANLLDRLEDAEDTITILESRGKPTTPATQVYAELGL